MHGPSPININVTNLTIRFLLESGVRIVHVFIRSHCGSSFSFAWRNGANEIGVRYENKRDAF